MDDQTPAVDLEKMVQDMPGPRTMPLRDACAKFGFVHCVVCYRGGHTRTPLYTVYADGTAREMVKACPDHVGKFIRPKDVGR